MSYHRMKDVPQEERPYEKFKRSGAESLSEAELLAVILRTGCKGEKVTDVAMKILELGPFFEIPMADFRKLPGIGEVKAIQLKCIAEFSKRLWTKAHDIRMQIVSPKTIADYYMQQLCHSEVEHTYVILMDGKNHFIGDCRISTGTVKESLVSTREIFKEAIRKNAVYIILMHNHPSGDPTPSSSDILVTKRVAEAGKLMDIPLLDHIIIGNGKYISLHEKGLY